MDKRELVMSIARDVYLHLLDYTVENAKYRAGKKPPAQAIKTANDLVAGGAATIDDLAKRLAKTYDDLG